MNRVQFYYMCDNQQQGPVSVEELNKLAARGRLRSKDLVWQLGTPGWVPAAKVAGVVAPPPRPAMVVPVAERLPEATPARRRPAGGSKRVRGLDFIRGTVSCVRRSVEAWGDRDGAGTSHVLSFMIGSQPVEVNMSKFPQIEEGDDVAVAGHLEQGRLQARAYRNWSNGSYDSWGFPGSYCVHVGLCLTLMGVAVPPVLLISLPLILIGLYRILSGLWKNCSARRLVNDQCQN